VEPPGKPVAEHIGGFVEELKLFRHSGGSGKPLFSKSVHNGSLLWTDVLYGGLARQVKFQNLSTRPGRCIGLRSSWKGKLVSGVIGLEPGAGARGRFVKIPLIHIIPLLPDWI
jgi:hypothetical protein